MPDFLPFQTLGLAREIESPENPGGLEKRVALVPEDVNALGAAGLKVFVEHGAGEAMGFADQQYVAAGAVMQPPEHIYQNKDLVIKFKGPAMASIEQMRPGCTLFCMAHFHSFPERAERLRQQRINVLAMEEVVESPKVTTDATILSRKAMAAALQPSIDEGTIAQLHVRVLGWTPELAGCIRRAGNRSPASLQVLPFEPALELLDVVGPQALYFYDSTCGGARQTLIEHLRLSGAQVFDRADFVRQYGAQALLEYRDSHQPFEFGLRRIQCLHETGQAGARYGLQCLAANKPDLDLRQAKVLVLGYGNVGSGALHELFERGVQRVHVLGKRHTQAQAIVPFLQDVDLVVNGAEQPRELRGVNFLITKDQVRDIIPQGSVVIDLVGGSPSNRSPVESVTACTFLTDPHFVEHGVTISSLWGWPMMGMMRETAVRYSGQITDVLLGHERLMDGLGSLRPGVNNALVCGPFLS